MDPHALAVWFWAAYLMVTDKRGVSALLLQRQLALRRYETAWMMLHKFRRAMVNVARQPLQGEVEVDDTWVGGPQAGLRGSLLLNSSSTVCDAKWRQLVDSTQGDASRREIIVSRHFSQLAANRYCYLQLSARS